MVETKLEEEFESARKVIAQIRFTLSFVGLWPLDRYYVRFFIWITYFGLYICMEFADFYVISGNLELMIANLMESGFALMLFIGMIVMRFSETIRQSIILVEEKVRSKYYDCDEDKVIFLRYITSVARFHRISMAFSSCSVVFYYIKPGVDFIIAHLSTTNQTILLKTPTRINFFYKPDTNFKNVIFYFFEMPVMYTGLYRVTMISLLMMLVFTVCSQLAILSRTVEHITPNNTHHRIFHQIVEKHLHVISMTQYIERGFDYLLLFELTVTTILLGLIAYNGILNFDNADKLSLLSIVVYGSTMLIVIFGNCLIGEYLIYESTNLYKSFAKCMWYDMPIAHQKCLLICMTNSLTPLYITAGRFYVFSLSGYTNILKTSMAYFSMLRTLTTN